MDPDDRTPGGIRDTGAKIVTYGAPVLPGAMLLVAYLERNGRSIPVLGLPGCVMYAKRTVFDLILPRVMADDEIKAEEIARYGRRRTLSELSGLYFPKLRIWKII